MIKKSAIVINDFSGGMDTKTPIISMPLNKSPNMRNFHCKGVGTRLIKRGGFDKLNLATIETDNLDVYYSPGYQTYDYPLRTTAAYTQISQGFKCNTSSTVTKVKLLLKKFGTPAGTDTITLEIQTDASGVPSGTEVTNGVSTAVDISDTATLVTTGYSWVEFTFATAPTLVAGTQYHLVLYGAYTASETNYITWGADNYDVIYPDGSMSVNDATTWVTQPLYNACFEVYITGGAKGNDGVAIWDFSSKNMLLGIFGTSVYRMDKNSLGNPDGVWDALPGGSNWDVYTKLMMHCDASPFTDEIGKAVTNNGTVTCDGVNKVFGAGAAAFNGTTQYFSFVDSIDWKMDGGMGSPFTFEGRFRLAAVNAQYAIFSQGLDSSNFMMFSYSGTNSLVVDIVSAGGYLLRFACDFTPSADTWYSICLERIDNSDLSAGWKILINGVSIALSKVSGSWAAVLPDYGGTFNIGADYAGTGSFFSGQMDEIKYSKGIAYYSADYTIAVAAFSASAVTLTSSRFWTMADWQSGRALINTDIGMYTYTGIGNVSTVTAAPLGKFIIIWKKYCFSFGIRGSPNNGQYSALGDYTTWPAANTFSNAFDTSDGDVITGVRILKGKLYVFKRYSIFRITYLGSNPTFQVDQISGFGCPSHYTIKEVDMGGDLGTVLIFLTTDKKLAIFDGYNVQVISDVLTEETNDLFASADDQPLSFNDMNLKFVDLFHATVNSSTQEYILYSVLGTDTSINYAFVFDYRTGGIYPYDGQAFASSCYALATNKIKKLYCSGYTGYTWIQESGDDDDGVSINAYWVSGKVKSTSVALLNKNLLLGINVKEITSSSSISLSLQYRFDWNVSWNTAQTFRFDHNDELAFGKTAMFEIGSINNMIQFKLKDNSSNPAPTIYSLELYGEPVPLGVSVQERATS